MAPNKDKNMVEKLRAFYRSNQANKRCADCPERGPTYVCLDFQIFVCQACSGLHREFGHKIKSISFSEWSPAEVAKVEEGGNEVARAKWLDRWHSDSFSEPDGNDLEALREWIRLKYVEKKWYRPHAKPTQAEATPQVPEATQKAVDLLGESLTAPAPAVPQAQVPDLLGSLEASAQEWTADFGNVAKAPDSTSGLIDLDFSSPPKAAPPKQEDLMALDRGVEEPAAEPQPTEAEAERQAGVSMGEKLRQAVLSGSQDDLKRLFEQCSKAPAKKAVDEKRLAAFSAFDDLLKPPEAVAAGPPAEASTRPPPKESSPKAKSPDDKSPNGAGPQMFFIGDDSIGEDPQSVPSQPSAPQLAPELFQNSNGAALANSLTPHQLERMSPQELVQLQAMISSALQSRAPPAPAATQVAGVAPAVWSGYRPQPANRMSSFDLAQEDGQAAPFGELLDMFQKKNPGR